MIYKYMNKTNIKRFFSILLILCIFSYCSSFVYASDESLYVWSSNANALLTNATTEVTDNNSLNLESASAILIEQSSGRILYAHNIHEQLRPASVTKVMSILLIMESLNTGKISLTDSVPCSENAAAMGGSQIWLDTTETLTVDEMLKAICVNSANDCVVAMAEYIAGSEEAFVQMMNDKAYELGMSDTTFKNCNF